MIDPDNLERVAQLTAERHLKSFAEDVLKKKFEFHSRGLVQSSCFEDALGKLAVIKSRQLAEAVADVIAQSCGRDAHLHVNILQKVYEKSKPHFLAHYRKNTIHEFDSSNMIRKIREPVELQIAANFSNCVDELQLDMVRGQAIVGSGSENINNYNIYGGTGFAIGSKNIAIAIGGDNLTQTVDWNRDAFLQALQEFREALASEHIPVEAKEELDAWEREAKAESPDHGLLKRSLKGFAARMETFGIGAASSLFVNHLPTLMAALR